MRVDSFDFDLPDELIALRPARPRDRARLLHVGANGLADRTVRDLPDLLDPDDLLVFNDTRVIPAQLFGVRLPRAEARVVAGSGAQVFGPRIGATLHARIGPNTWRAFVKPGRKLEPDDRITFGGALGARVHEKHEAGDVTLAFEEEGEALDRAIAAVGVTPLPPYIAARRPADDQDREDYQTVYAERQGSVAAPTAGLHFTPELLAALERRGVRTARVTLHVGAGTFLPVKAEDTADHVMHAEWGEVSEAAAAEIARTRARGGRVVAVGTTALRLLETAADGRGGVRPFAGETDIFITPGYRFRVVDRLMTNFHLPRSTLFMLVAAFSGLERMRAAYAHAIAERYRFYSYGDASLLERADG